MSSLVVMQVASDDVPQNFFLAPSEAELTVVLWMIAGVLIGGFMGAWKRVRQPTEWVLVFLPFLCELCQRWVAFMLLIVIALAMGYAGLDPQSTYKAALFAGLASFTVLQPLGESSDQ